MQRLSLDLQQKEIDLRSSLISCNKIEGEKAGLESSLSSLQEEVNILRKENEELIQIGIRESRKNREIVREFEGLKCSMKIEKEELEISMRGRGDTRGDNRVGGVSQPSTPGGFGVTSLESVDQSSSRPALIEIILWLETKINFTIENSGISSGSGILSSGSTFLSPSKTPVKGRDLGSRIQNPYRVTFADKENDVDNIIDNNDESNSNYDNNTDSTSVLISHIRKLANTAIIAREQFISKQQALLLVLEKQLDAAQSRLQLEVEGSGQVGYCYLFLYCVF